jgi:phosphoribosylformimino-5-aminoimidazole carboxamide ribotide isomerase
LEALRRIGCTGAIVGKAIYENKISLTMLSKF